MANNTTPTPQLEKAGDIEFLEVIISTKGSAEIDIRQFVGELNLFEDMFAPGLYGNLLVIDALNLNNIIDLTGDEWLTLKMRTPGMPDNQGLIHKTFKIYSITDKVMISDTGKQSYVIHFCSAELFLDTLQPQYKTFTGRIDNVVSEIFNDCLRLDRNIKNSVTNLYIVGPTQNEVKFTSPGWRPVQCINWLASKALGEGYKNPGYLFYESNKAFYFANVEALIDHAAQSKAVYQNYVFSEKKLSSNQDQPNERVQNLDIDYARAEHMQVIESINAFKNLQNGYYGSKLFSLDLQTKSYNRGLVYDHVQEYKNYHHLEEISGSKSYSPPFINPEYNPAAHLSFYPKHQNLYTGFYNNVADIIEQTMPLRRSLLAELNNFKIEITVPGRTDIQVGFIVGFLYPDAAPRDESDRSKLGADELYTGYYLITAIRHKFTMISHVMTLELAKDSLRRRPK
jgi:hypothetical protein